MADKQQVLESVFGMLDRLVEKASEYTHLEEENEKLRLGLANREEELEDLQSTIKDMQEDLDRYKRMADQLQDNTQNLSAEVERLKKELDKKQYYIEQIETVNKRFTQDWRTHLASLPEQGAGSVASRLMREAGLRSNPCIEKAGEGEPTFTLRAKDMLAPECVREWAFRAKRAGSPKDKVDDARRIADEMEDWQIANQRHVPD
jgi:archaellum component FlaC